MMLLFFAVLTTRNFHAPSTPQTPVQVHTPIATTATCIASSTPNPSMLTPLSVQGSPLADATIAMALAQMKQGSAQVQNSPSVVPSLNASPVLSLVTPVPSIPAVTPSTAPTTPVRCSTALSQTLLNSSINGKSPLPPLVIRQTSSPMSAAKTILHSHCPYAQQAALSPLLKVAASPVQAGNSLTLAATEMSPPVQISKSPSRKIVTVSKLPTSEQISVFLQQLQNSPQSATAELSKLISSAASSLNSGQLLNGSGSHSTSSIGTASQPTSTQAGLLTNLSSGTAAGKTSQSFLVSNGQ